MTTTFDLSLPVDIPWKRICVSEDMIDDAACDGNFPPKWQTSVAVFKYVPDETYQRYPDYDVSYLKVSVSLGGYQPQAAEIGGSIDWSGVGTTVIDQVEALLNEYMPCTGAIVQVSLHARDHDVSDDRQPFVLDFEPKKRELYELATDTLERSSRSLESLNVAKSAGTTQSLEVLDVDMGGSVAAQGEASFAGTGGGFGFSTSHQGQWGTKAITANESGVIRTTDRSDEKRETHSFTTQLSQLYHLLNAYHVGTNRALFFIQPRPHVIENPTGFVRGPRAVEGLQEFFLVVAQPKGQGEYCVTVRVDTAHLTEIDILEHDFKTDSFTVQAIANPPGAAGEAGTELIGQKSLGVQWPTPLGMKEIGERHYDCYKKTVTEVDTYVPPWSDFLIESFAPEWQSQTHAGGSFELAPDQASLTAKVWAWSRRCFDAGGSPCADCPDTIGDYSGLGKATVEVKLKTREPTVKVGTDQVVLITTRLLCCCPLPIRPEMAGILAWKPVSDLVIDHGPELLLYPDDLPNPIDPVRLPDLDAIDRVRIARDAARVSAAVSQRQRMGVKVEAPAGDAAQNRAVELRPDVAQQIARRPRGMDIRAANALGQVIANELRRRASDARARKPQPYLLSDLFALKLERRLRQTPHGRAWLGQQAQLPAGASAGGLRELFGRNEPSHRDIFATASSLLAEKAGLAEDSVARVRLESLGLRVTPRRPRDEPG